MTDAQLIAEFTVDPANLGYAAKNAEARHELITRVRDTIQIAKIVDVATVLGVLGSVPFRVAAMPEPGKTAWLQVLANIRSLKEGLKPTDPSVAPLLAQGVTDGVITPEEKASLESLGVRPGSRAEQLWGEGATVSLNDVARVS